MELADVVHGTGIAEDHRLGGRLALWGRRLMGEALTQAQRVAGDRDSLTALLAYDDLGSAPLPVRRAAWYLKEAATFSDTLAYVRRTLWPTTINRTSRCGTDVVMIPRTQLERFTDLLAFAA